MSLSLDPNDYHFELPQNLIAQRPSAHRDQSKLMVVDLYPEKNDYKITHHYFNELPEIINSRPLLQNNGWIRNTSKVFPARFYVKRETGGQHEVLLLNPVITPENQLIWNCKIKNSAKIRLGQQLYSLANSEIKFTYCESFQIKSQQLDSLEKWHQFLDRYGEMPIPPYIKTKDPQQDKERYQSLWADSKQRQSVAAPTASLHFSKALLKSLKLNFIDVNLHIGLGTFAPLTEQNIKNSKLHSEQIYIPESENKKITDSNESFTCIGTTALRTLQSLCHQQLKTVDLIKDKQSNLSGQTSLFIKPGFDIQRCHTLLTNFHLPKSSLFILLATFCQSREIAIACYQEAIKEKYRFFSYGDASLWIIRKD